MVFAKVCGRSKGNTTDAICDGDEGNLCRLPLRGEDGVKVGIAVREERLGDRSDVVDVHYPSTAHCKPIRILSAFQLAPNKLTAGHNPDQNPKITRAQ